MKGRRVVVPEGLSAQTWRIALKEIIAQSLRETGITCMSVSITSRGDVAIRDPHQHLDDADARAVLREEIRSCCDPVLASVICEVVLGR